MAKDTYKKRMKGNWQQGKGYKGDSEERMYARKEIEQAIQAEEDDYLEKYHKGARTRNEKARLEHQIAWYTQVLAETDRRMAAEGKVPNWESSFASYFRDSLKKAKKKYEEMFGELPKTGET
jgi:hypothetical protein